MAGAAAALTLRPGFACAEASGAAFAAACVDESGAHAVAVFGQAGAPLRTAALPARGHDIAVRPGTREAVVFARRPGTFAVVFDAEDRLPPLRIDCSTDRHFFGHGAYSSDGRLLFSTENDIAGGRGVLGVRDCSNGYAPIGTFASGGIGPHDIALLSNSRMLAVANGGIDTDPHGRDVIDLAGMRPSLAYIDLVSGDLVDRLELDDALRPLSIRHLAVGAGGRVVFGCQWEGSRTEHPPLVGTHRRGEAARFADLPAEVLRRMKHYAGSVAVDSSGEIAVASAPKGGIAVYWDVATGRYLGVSELADVCGVAGSGNRNELVLTSGYGAIRTEHTTSAGAAVRVSESKAPVQWDNHAVRL